MLKRTNKTIALLVAATTVISTIPVIASEKNKIERLNESDGSITNAVAFSDGKYLYEGSKGDADHGVYYYNGTKDTKLDKVEDLDEYTKYGDGSVVVLDGSKEEKINLADGTLSSDGDRDDELTTTKLKLQSTLSKTNKYGNDTEIKSFTEVSNNKFGDDVWYAYTATGNGSYYTDATVPDLTDTNTAQPKSQITVKVCGIWGPCTIAGKSFSNIYGVQSLETAVKATSFTGYTVKSTAIASDNGSDILTIVFATTEELNNMVPSGFVTGLSDWANGYAEATASAYVPTSNDTNSNSNMDNPNAEKVIYYGYCDSKGNYIDCSKIANIRVYNGKSTVGMENFNDKKTQDDIKIKLGLPKLNKTLGQDKNYIYNLIEVPVIGYQPVNASALKPTATTTLCYVQKLSKIHSNTKDGGAYVPQDVNSYYLCNDCGWDGGDNWSYMAAYYKLNDSKDDADRQIRIIDGNIFVAHETTNDKGELEVTYGKLKLKAGRKITPAGNYASENKSEVVQPIVYEDFANNTKIGDVSGDTDSGSWTIDTKGNAWAIYNGRIKMSGQGSEWQDMYRCSMMNRLSVYDENNLIAWDNNGDNYVTVRDGEAKENTVTKTGWQKTDDGKWHLYDLTGKDSKGWINYNSCWYYFDDQGIMQTGWLTLDGKTYYLAASGVRQAGWVQVENKWYYLDESGVKQVSTTISGYKIDSNGVMIN